MTCGPRVRFEPASTTQTTEPLSYVCYQVSYQDAHNIMIVFINGLGKLSGQVAYSNMIGDIYPMCTTAASSSAAVFPPQLFGDFVSQTRTKSHVRIG